MSILNRFWNLSNNRVKTINIFSYHQSSLTDDDEWRKQRSSSGGDV